MLEDLPRRYVWAERYIMRIKDRRADLERGMAETIQRIKQAVEGSAEHLITGSGRRRVEILGSRRARMGTDIARRHLRPGDAPHLGVPMVRPLRVGTGPVRPTRRPPPVRTPNPGCEARRHGPRTREFREAGT